MKVILINGSRREKGCTYTALQEVASALEKNGVETELFFVGKDAVSGDIKEAVDRVGRALKDADGLVVGSPVYYASPSGEILAFLDRLFWNWGKELHYKPGAAVVSARRAGTTASLDVLNKYFTFCEMPIVSSNYWTMVHGSNPEEVRRDEEGMQMMRTLGNNMAWLLKCIEAGREKGLEPPVKEERVWTNFIR